MPALFFTSIMRSDTPAYARRTGGRGGSPVAFAARPVRLAVAAIAAARCCTAPGVDLGCARWRAEGAIRAGAMRRRAGCRQWAVASARSPGCGMHRSALRRSLNDQVQQLRRVDRATIRGHLLLVASACQPQLRAPRSSLSSVCLDAVLV